MDFSPNTEATIRNMQNQLNKLQTLICDRITFTTVEMALKTGLDERTICKYCKDGAIRAIQLTNKGSYLIPITELDRILEEANQSKRKDQELSTYSLNKLKRTH